jgi:cytochrome c-type biogenesis protein CcmH
MVRKYLTALLVAACVGLSHAGEAQPIVEDPVLEARVQSLAEVLRCLVCQNQNLADSHADLAIDLKNQVRAMLKQGKSEQEVIDYMVQRYGDFVLYRPPVKGTTWLLWGGPFILVGGGLIALFVNLKRRRQRAGVPLSDAERNAAAQLLNGQVEGQK